MEDYINAALKKDNKRIKELLPTELPGLYGLGYSLPEFCETEDDYVAACYVFNEMVKIKDGLSRSEIMSTAITTLFERAYKNGQGKVAMKINGSKAYGEVRKVIAKFNDSFKDDLLIK